MSPTWNSISNSGIFTHVPVSRHQTYNRALSSVLWDLQLVSLFFEDGPIIIYVHHRNDHPAGAEVEWIGSVLDVHSDGVAVPLLPVEHDRVCYQASFWVHGESVPHNAKGYLVGQGTIETWKWRSGNLFI